MFSYEWCINLYVHVRLYLVNLDVASTQYLALWCLSGPSADMCMPCRMTPSHTFNWKLAHTFSVAALFICLCTPLRYSESNPNWPG